jgi:hypothetical protein
MGEGGGGRGGGYLLLRHSTPPAAVILVDSPHAVCKRVNNMVFTLTDFAQDNIPHLASRIFRMLIAAFLNSYADWYSERLYLFLPLWCWNLKREDWRKGK